MLYFTCILICYNFVVGNFRTGGLVALLLLEAIMGWNFISYLLSRREDNSEAKVKQPGRKSKETKSSEKKKN